MELRQQKGLKSRLKTQLNRIRIQGKPKIFCIGFNKTGTTSLKIAMEEFGYIVGNEYHAKFLFNDWIIRDFRSTVNYCKSAEFFQDSPFSLPYTFIAMDQAFPNSKFILTVRDNDEQWYNSLIRFHGKLWGNGNIPPTSEDLKNATSNAYKGRPFHTIMNIYNVKESEPYQKNILIEAYNDHIKLVKDYFRHRPQDLIVINIKEKYDYERLCKFLMVEMARDEFPWENKT